MAENLTKYDTLMNASRHRASLGLLICLPVRATHAVHVLCDELELPMKVSETICRVVRAVRVLGAGLGFPLGGPSVFEPQTTIHIASMNCKLKLLPFINQLIVSSKPERSAMLILNTSEQKSFLKGSYTGVQNETPRACSGHLCLRSRMVWKSQIADASSKWIRCGFVCKFPKVWRMDVPSTIVKMRMSKADQ